MDKQLDIMKGCLRVYLQQKGISLNKNFRCLNPMHVDHNPSMRYNMRAENVHCFACGETYDILDLIGIDYCLNEFGEQYEKACELFEFKAILRWESTDQKKEMTTFLAQTSREDEFQRLELLSDKKFTYFKKRGITQESCEKYRFFQDAERAYLPLLEDGRCMGWVARAMEMGIEPRYKNSTGSLGIWNGDLLLQSGLGRCLFITEGIMDAVVLEQMGYSAIALCGSQNTRKLLNRLEEMSSRSSIWRYVICGDPDAAGHKMNKAIKEGLYRLGLVCIVLELTPDDGDIGELYLSDPKRLEVLLQSAINNEDDYTATSALIALDAFFAESKRRCDKGAISTGYRGLDKLLDGGLYGGLYVIGAISSLGKTSFVLQIADHIAANGQDVLFYSLEQSCFELMAKSLSRLSAIQNRQSLRDAFTVRQLLNGYLPDSTRRQQLLVDTRAAYARMAGSLFIREGLADIGVAEIYQAVREHREKRGRAPVVVVDYLQILRSAEPRASDKQNTDRAVVELKRLSRDFDIPVIAISSFNRENYRAVVSMEAFKESGAVEYSSDVLLGMQLVGAGEKDFDVNRAKIKEPRQVELVLLKNRNGIPWAKVKFQYFAKFNLFAEEKECEPIATTFIKKRKLAQI